MHSSNASSYYEIVKLTMKLRVYNKVVGMGSLQNKNNKNNWTLIRMILLDEGKLYSNGVKMDKWWTLSQFSFQSLGLHLYPGAIWITLTHHGASP